MHARILASFLFLSGLSLAQANEISVPLGYAKIVNLPAGAVRVEVDNSEVADAILLQRNAQFILKGTGEGVATVTAFGANDEILGTSDIRVEKDEPGQTIGPVRFDLDHSKTRDLMAL